MTRLTVFEPTETIETNVDDTDICGNTNCEIATDNEIITNHGKKLRYKCDFDNSYVYDDGFFYQKIVSQKSITAVLKEHNINTFDLTDTINSMINNEIARIMTMVINLKYQNVEELGDVSDEILSLKEEIDRSGRFR